MDQAILYANERVQFGQKLIAFPRVADKIAMMAAEIMIARQISYYAAREKDKGRRCDLEAGMAKLLAARVAWAAADNAAADPWRQRLCAGVPDFPHPVRRPHPVDLRGRGGNPGAGDRAAAARRAELASYFHGGSWPGSSRGARPGRLRIIFGGCHTSEIAASPRPMPPWGEGNRIEPPAKSQAWPAAQLLAPASLRRYEAPLRAESITGGTMTTVAEATTPSRPIPFREVWLISAGHMMTHWYPSTFYLLLPADRGEPRPELRPDRLDPDCPIRGRGDVQHSGRHVGRCGRPQGPADGDRPVLDRRALSRHGPHPQLLDDARLRGVRGHRQQSLASDRDPAAGAELSAAPRPRGVDPLRWAAISATRWRRWSSARCSRC